MPGICTFISPRLPGAFIVKNIVLWENFGAKEVDRMNPYQQNMYGIPGYGFRGPMYNAAPQPAAMPQQMAVTPVTGMAQVEAAQVAFDGTPAYFYDTSADAVYIKQFDPRNGTSPIVVYRREQQPPPPQYATVEMLGELSRRVEEMSAMIQPRRKTAKEAEAE